MKINTKKLLSMLSNEDSDGVAREVNVTTASASATKDHPTAPEAEANSDGQAAPAADTVSVGNGDGVTPTIQDAIDKGVQVGDDITKMESAQASVEHHLEIVQAHIDANESISPALAQTIQTSLKRYDPKFFATVVPSVEDFSAATGRMTATMNVCAKLETCGKALASALISAKAEYSRLAAIASGK